MNKLRKTISLLTIFAMLLSFMSISAFAEEADDVPEPLTISTEVIMDYLESYLITLDAQGTITSIEGLSEAALALLDTFNTDEETPFDWSTQSIEAALASLIDATVLPVSEDDVYAEGDAIMPEFSVMSNDETSLTSIADELATAFEVEVATELLVEESLEEELACEDCDNCEEGEYCDNCEEQEECDRPEFIQERFNKANELGITNGKMRLLEKLLATLDLEEGTELSIEELKELAAKSVKEIMAEAKANRKGKLVEDDRDDTTELDEVSEETELSETTDTIKTSNSTGPSTKRDKIKGKGSSKNNGKRK